MERDMSKKYTGLRSPLGKPYDMDSMQLGGVMLTPTDYKVDAVALRYTGYMANLTRLLDIALSVFKWDNLPEGVDMRSLEWFLLCRGCAVFFYDPDMVGSEDAPEGYAVLPVIVNGGFDLYGYPKDRKAYSINGYNVDLTEENSVLIYNNQLRFPMLPVLSWFAQRITGCDMAIDMNVANQKVSKVGVVDEKTKLSIENILQQYDDGVGTILTTKNFNPNQITNLDLSAPFTAADVMAVRNQIFNQALTYVGVENVNTDKKERMVSNEVYGGMGAVEAQRFTRLVPRTDAATKINEKFGLDIEVDFRSGVYIRTDKEGTVPTDGMQDGIGEPSVDDIMKRIYSNMGD